MVPGEIVQVVKGEHEGKRCRINMSDGFFFHVQLLTPGDRKAANGLISLHRTALTPIMDEVESRA
jgi:hypothetical protein